MREILKTLARLVAFVLVLPALLSFYLRARLLGRDRALEGSTEALSLIPGLAGQYLRRAFLARTLEACHPATTISFGTIFSQSGARLDENVYVGPGCVLGLVHIERDVLLGSGVHVTSGRKTHGVRDLDLPIREQPMVRTLVRIGAGAWVGSGAIIMADVGQHSVVGAGAVVTKPIPNDVIAVGVPARVIRARGE